MGNHISDLVYGRRSRPCSVSLDHLYGDIVSEATIDRSSDEMQDISSAMQEIMERLFGDGIEINFKDDFTSSNENIQTMKFGPSHPVLCGSMAECTSLWKGTKRQGKHNTFIEFDYLTILGDSNKVVDIRDDGCEGCRTFFKKNKSLKLNPNNFVRDFLSALYSKVENACSCRVAADSTYSEDEKQRLSLCDKCTVLRETGYLQIAKISGLSQDDVKDIEQCSLVFYWTSNTGTLLAPSIATLQPTETIERLLIRVDILPALEYQTITCVDQTEIKRFIIGKDCPYCEHGGFMISYCMNELNAIQQVSEKHKQSFIIMKFLYGQISYWTGLDPHMNSYHAKVAFLTHCETCKHEHKDSSICVTEILQSLQNACRSMSLKLPEFHQVKSLKIGKRDIGGIDALLHAISKLTHHIETQNCDSENLSFHAIGLLKESCRMMIEIRDLKGEVFHNAVPAIEILGALLADTSLCDNVVRGLVREERLGISCPESEKEILYWRAACLVKMIWSSDINDIRDETIKEAVSEIQECDKTNRQKQNLFLTSSHSDKGASRNDSKLSPQTRSRNNVQQTFSLFTDDLQINWSGLPVAKMEELKEIIRRRKSRCMLM